MNTKHGVKLAPWPVQSLADEALERGYTHIWALYPAERLSVPQSGGDYSWQENVRHEKTATVSCWKRGSGHVNIIYLNNTAWMTGTAAFRAITPAELLHAVNEIEDRLGVPVSGSPATVGWKYLKKLHPEWVEDIPVNLKGLGFTPKAGPDIIWQMGESRPLGWYLVKFDKSSAYSAAAATTDIGVGTPFHFEGRAAELSAEHTKGHPQEVGVWLCHVKGGNAINTALPPKRLMAGNYWLAGPHIRMLRAANYDVKPLEGWVFPERHDLLAKWAKDLWFHRQDTSNPIVKNAFKQIPNTTIGYTGFHGFEDDEEEKKRPDIKLQVVSRNAEIMWHNINKVRQEFSKNPVMVYMDALYYVCEKPEGHPIRGAFAERSGKLGGFKYEGSIEITPEVKSMFERKMAVAERLQFLNKIGWAKA